MSNLETRIRSQLSRGELVLFTGAGFSLAAHNRTGSPIPSSSQLKEMIWALCFPDTELDGDSTLGELYELALRRRPKDLEALLVQQLSVDAESLPEFYRYYFNFPWFRIYTLNIDDLDAAASRTFSLDRRIDTVVLNAENPPGHSTEAPFSALQVIHLNGMIGSSLDQLTFSELQYAKRLITKEPWYALCAADITSRPTVFIGTLLGEMPLWQHLEMRRRDTRRGRALRPSSVLVTPTLNEARRAILEELRIEWFPGTAETFAETFLGSMTNEAKNGIAYLDRQERLRGLSTVPLVSELSAERPNLSTEYLLGSEPHWSDLLTGRAIERTDDGRLLESALAILGAIDSPAALAVVGTAGTGKSTALMRLSLALTDKGIPTLWVDKESDAAPATIRARVQEHDGPLALAIDDADLFGHHLRGLLNDLVPTHDNLLFVFAVRSGKIQSIVTDLERAGQIVLKEHSVPPLTNDDIDALIDTLERHNRLGILKGKAHSEQRQAFSRQAGRQLLVAMIQATSGKDLEAKVTDELEELEGRQRFLYALICVTSHLRHYLTSDEVLIATGSDDGERVLADLQQLAARHLVRSEPPFHRYRARHRVIASLVFDRLQETGSLRDVIEGAAFSAATKAIGTQRNSRPWRLLKSLINHQFLVRVLPPPDARAIYEPLETILQGEYHYWLQRGSVEVEIGDLRLAENFLDQARSLSPEDFRVETEYGYLLLKQARLESSTERSARLFKEGVALLEDKIDSHGQLTPYPYHILGTQGMEWLQVAQLSQMERRRILDQLMMTLERGVKNHPFSKELRQVKTDIERARLLTVVANDKKTNRS